MDMDVVLASLLSGVDRCWGGCGEVPLLLGTHTLCLHPRARSQACYWPTGTCNTGDSPTLVRGLHACLEPSPGGLWEGPLSTTYTPQEVGTFATCS